MNRCISLPTVTGPQESLARRPRKKALAAFCHTLFNIERVPVCRIACFRRRDLLRQTGVGRALALAYLLRQEGLLADNVRGPEKGSKACFPRRAISRPVPNAPFELVQNGGPSQMDLFDPKPELQKNNGKQHSFKVETLSARQRVE